MLPNARRSQEPKRIRSLRTEIVKGIPKFPNDRQTAEELHAKALPDLLLAYLNWACRLVPPRQRSVTIEPTVTGDRRWKALASEIQVLLDKVRGGQDLTPHLSLRTRRYGYRREGAGTAADKWEDKDFAVITLGFHHFHLGEVTPHGHAERHDEVLFAQVGRAGFNAVAIFDHTVFQQTATPMPPERERMWRIYDARVSVGRLPGVYLAANPIASSGHAVQHARMAADYAWVIGQIDPKLDDLRTRQEVFPDIAHETVKSMKLVWCLYGLDIGLMDRASGTYYILRKGPI